jgi:TolB protein
MIIRGVVAVAVALLGLAVVGARSHAQPASRRDGRIIVLTNTESSATGPSPRLLMIDADGKKPRLRGNWVVEASLSPDGRLIAYERIPDGRHGKGNTRLEAADGRPRDRLFVRNASEVEWSRRGDAIAFVRQGGCCGRQDIWVEDLRSRKQRRVARDGDTPDWSADNKKLAFVRQRGEDESTSAGRSIWTVDLETKKLRRLIRGADSPRLSPDGRRIAFRRFNQYDSFIYVARADGTRARRVARADSAAWSPDGTELAVAGVAAAVARMRPDGTHRRVVFACAPPWPACDDIHWSR